LLVLSLRLFLLFWLQGYDSGGSLPCSAKNLYDLKTTSFSLGQKLIAGFEGRLRRWDGTPSGRQRATPHMKCYFRYNISSPSASTDSANGSPSSSSSSFSPKSHSNIELSWFVLTSANLSQAAWGVHEKGVSQIYVKSFEMGVLFLPNKVKTLSRSFSCTPYHPLLGIDPDNLLIKEEPVNEEPGKKKETSLFFADLRNESYEKSDCSQSIVCFPIPFVIPPQRYLENVDYPWVWDYPFQTPDVHGRRRVV
jgi:hypothetical protein